MIAVNCQEEKLYGCPNCGCDTWIRDSCYRGDQPGGTCKSCGLHYQIIANGITKSSVGFGTKRKDMNGNTIMEYPILTSHPRNGIPSWHWEIGENSNLSGFSLSFRKRNLKILLYYILIQELGRTIMDF